MHRRLSWQGPPGEQRPVCGQLPGGQEGMKEGSQEQGSAAWSNRSTPGGSPGDSRDPSTSLGKLCCSTKWFLPSKPNGLGRASCTVCTQKQTAVLLQGKSQQMEAARVTWDGRYTLHGMEGSERFPWEQHKGGEFYFCSQPRKLLFLLFFFFLYFFCLFCLSLLQRPLPSSFWQMTSSLHSFQYFGGKSQSRGNLPVGLMVIYITFTLCL